jgi:predicted permease
MNVRDYARQRGEDLEFPYASVSDGYFETMQVEIVRGRAIDARDGAGAPGVVVVSESFAKRFWPRTDPLGQGVSVQGPAGPFLTVVGVARDGKYQTMTEDPVPFVYFPLAQEYNPVLTLVARTGRDPAMAVRSVRSSLLAVDPDLPTFSAQTLEEHLALTLMPQRVVAAVLGSFGAVALLLAAMGIYGIVAFSVSQRTREIGVRVALGAARTDVIRLMVSNGMRPVVIGVGIGLVSALAVTRLLKSFLTGVSPTDPATFAGVMLAFLGVALWAALLPARRAAHIDPLVALRSE